MVSSEPRKIAVPLTVVPLSTRGRVPAEAPCLGCGSAPQLHQPDGNAPERLLGTCDACGAWHLIECDGSVVVLLPDATALCATEAVHQPSKPRRGSPSLSPLPVGSQRVPTPVTSMNRRITRAGMITPAS